MGVALIDRVGFEVDAIDVFCGYGGTSQGMKTAGVTVRAAANHNAVNLECYGRNFPETDLWQADLADPADPQVINRLGKKVAGRYLDPGDLPRARYAWFSPACTHHSPANAAKVFERGLQLAMFEADDDWDEQSYVNSERSRVTMSCVLRYVAAAHPEIIAVENVIEVTKWGPGRNGATFHWWMGELRKLGYEIQLCFLNSMFFPPCPQSRDRLYIVAHRKGNKAPDLDYRPTAYCTADQCGGRIVSARQSWKKRTAAWVTDTWGKYGGQYNYRCPECQAIVHPAAWMALTAVDWTNLGPTLESRIAAGKKPADSTWERIRRAMEKYRYAPPVVLPAETVQAHQVPVAHGETVSTSNTGSAYRHAPNRSRSAAEQLPTLAQRNTIGIVIDGAVIPIRSGRSRSDALTDPTAAVMADGSRLALALTVRNTSIAEATSRSRHLTEPAWPTEPISALIVPNRTNNVASHVGEAMAPVMTSATQTVVVTAAGNTAERPGQTRARHVTEALFTQSTTAEHAVASIPVLRGDHPQEGHPGEPMDTIAGGNHHYLATGLFSKINGGPTSTAWHPMSDPLNTITGRDTTGLVVVPWIEHWQSDPVHVTEQLATITARLRHTLASIVPSDEPITDEQMMQTRWRMFEPDPELRRAMAFDDDYILLGTKTQKTAGLGDAVTPPTASWITAQCLETLR